MSKLQSHRNLGVRAHASRPYHHGDLRRALLAAAEDELADRGIEGFSLRGVAKRAGVSHAAPAHHFTDANGLLTALAVIGFERFVAGQRAGTEAAGSDPRDRLIAAGQAYIGFALENPALFRLMFSSDRPDFTDESLCPASEAAFGQLVDTVAAVSGRTSSVPSSDGPAEMVDVAAIWAITHGLADLISAGRMKPLSSLPRPERDRLIGEIIARAV